MKRNKKLGVGQYDFISKYADKISAFGVLKKQLDVIFDKAKDFGEMYNFLFLLQQGDGSIYQPMMLINLDIWSLAADWWLWKHNLKFNCYFCKYFNLKSIGCVYVGCNNLLRKAKNVDKIIWIQRR